MAYHDSKPTLADIQRAFRPLFRDADRLRKLDRISRVHALNDDWRRYARMCRWVFKRIPYPHEVY